MPYIRVNSAGGVIVVADKLRALAMGVIEEEPSTQVQKRRRMGRVKPTADAVASHDQRLPRWADLPEDIIGLILKKLTLISDYDRFGAVCVSWRRVSLVTHNRNQRIESKIQTGVPLLLLHSDCLSEQEKEAQRNYDPMKHPVSKQDLKVFYRFKTSRNPWKRRLFDVFNKNMLTQNFNLPYLPKSAGRCCGSSHGWLIFADRYYSLTLVNPFYIGGGPSCGGGIVRLPSVDDAEDDIDSYMELNPTYKPELHVIKVVLSADPTLSPSQYALAAIMSNSLFFIRPGRDNRWTHVITNRGNEDLTIQDVLLRGNTIYAAVDGGALYSCEMTESKPKLRKVAPPPIVPPSKAYLVESSHGGQILLVFRLFILDGIYNKTTEFRVFKLLAPGGRLTAWHEVKNLGSNKALFLGENNSTWVELSASVLGYQQNSIYFTDDTIVTDRGLILDPVSLVPYKDVGIFNMDMRTIQRYNDLNLSLELLFFPPPVWFFPSLPGNWK